MKEADIITIYMQRYYITLEECRSALDFFSQTVEEKKNHFEHLFLKWPFKRKKIRWNGYLAPDKYFDSGIVKIQEGKAVDLKDKECSKICLSEAIEIIPNCLRWRWR